MSSAAPETRTEPSLEPEVQDSEADLEDLICPICETELITIVDASDEELSTVLEEAEDLDDSPEVVSGKDKGKGKPRETSREGSRSRLSTGAVGVEPLTVGIEEANAQE